MYSPRIIEANINRAIEAGLPPPYRHSLAEVDSWVEQLDSARALDDATSKWQQVRPFSLEEQRFIANEILLCRLDFRYWVSRYPRIKSQDDQIVRVVLRLAQEIVLDAVAEMEEQQIAIMLLILKARQLGVSRLFALMFLHRILFYGDINAVMASSTPEKSRELSDKMLEFVYDRLPFWMKPDYAAYRAGELFEYDNGSGVSIQHGSQMTGIARGTTPTIAHLTEMAEFINGQSIVDSSLLRAMHDAPNVMLALEGTAEGEDNWWHRKWLTATAGWSEHRSRLRPLFLPWFVGVELYPTPAWLRARPVPKDYRPASWAIMHKQSAEAYVACIPYLKKWLGEGWTMPVEQVWFYEVEREQAVKEGRFRNFLQEMPSTSDEAFQNTNISVFDIETIVHYRDMAMQQQLLGVYGLTGPLEFVPARLQPHASNIDRSRPSIPIKCQWNPTLPPIELELVPLLWEGWSLDDGENKIYIWEHPEPGEVYGMGVDTADGIDKDRSVIEGLRKGSPWSVHKQVFEFASGKASALDLVPFCLALGTYYSQYDTAQQRMIQPRVAIETKGRGEELQLKLRLLGWHNFHPWQRIDGKQLDKSQYWQIGIKTNSWFRSSMMEYLIKTVRDQEIIICSKFLVRELQTLQATELQQIIKAGGGSKDDRPMSLGFILVSLIQWERPNGTDGSRVATAPTVPTAKQLAVMRERQQREKGPRAPEFATWQFSGQDRPVLPDWAEHQRPDTPLGHRPPPLPESLPSPARQREVATNARLREAGWVSNPQEDTL